MKKLLNSPTALHLIGFLVGAYMHFAAATTRWRIVNEEVGQRLRDSGGPAVVCFWHGRILLAHAGYLARRGMPATNVLISRSREGEAVTRAARMIGFGVIRGSTETKDDKPKGAFEAMREMMRWLRDGGAVAITPDGPKGPRMRAEMGPIQLARLADAPLVPMAWSTTRRRVFDSWDRFILPWPFGRGVFIFGEPIHVPRRASDGEMEAARLALETELNRITREADTMTGALPVEPAAPAPALADASAA